MTTSNLTVERLRQVLAYDQESGLFTWREATSFRVTVGKTAGSPCKSGYIEIGVDGHSYYAHRLAWFYVTGEWPPHQVDHRDRVRTNNAFLNLRRALNAENTQNSVTPRAHNKSGYLGVSFDRRRGMFTAEIRAGNKRFRLGFFEDPKDASAAYWSAKKAVHPYWNR